MKIAFHANPLCHRGTTTATLDYAKYNEEILGNESIIFYENNPPKTFDDPGITPQDEYVVEFVKNRYKTIGYDKFSDIEFMCKDNGIDYFYNLKAGFNDGKLVPGVKNLVHAVFNCFDPHGEKYAYVSSWLAKQNSNYPFVPHIVSLPKEQKRDWRDQLKISKDKIVIGRYGGLNQFDIPIFVDTIIQIAVNHKEIEFVFVNTRKFCDLPNVRFLPAIIDPQDKTDFILSCDAMIHARSDGESFGLAICEGLFHSKPVFCFDGGRDKHHVDLLNGSGFLYRSPQQLYELILNSKNYYTYDFSKLVSDFSPDKVMEKFNSVFLS